MADFDAVSALLSGRGSDTRVSPDVQAQRDAERVQILRQERAQALSSGQKDVAAAVDREISRVGPTAPQPQQEDPFSKVNALLSASPSGPQPTQTPQTVDGTHRFTPAQEREGEREVAANAVTGLGSSIYGGLKGLLKVGTSLASGQGLDAALNAGANTVTQTQQDYTYQPRTAAGQDKLAGFNSAWNPLSLPAHVGNYLGEKTADATGSPGLGAAVNAGVQVFGPAAMVKGARSIGAKGIEAASTPKAPPRVEPVMEGQPSQLPNNPSPTLNTTSPAQPVVQKAGPSSPVKPPADNSVVVSPQEQTQRAQVLQQIGLDNVRRSAITGDAKAAATDFQTSKLDTPAGNYMRATLDSERQALENHADSIVQGTGGSVGMDQSTLVSRGNAIVAPLDAYKSWFDNNIKTLYKAADERAQGVPAPMENTKALLGGDQADFLGTVEGEQLLKGVTARMKSLGILGDEGTSATVQQAEQLKQYLNDQWTPRTARLIGRMKDAIDDDVTSAAGEDIYQQARQMRAQRARVLDDPEGVSKVMDADPNNPMNRAVSVEKIPATVAGMSSAQLQHLVKTLQEAPPEIQPQAQTALAEIKAQFANKLAETGKSQAGQWNAKGVRSYIQNNNERLSTVFSPEEMGKINTLRQAGDILVKDQSYPGAAIQEHNLVRAGAMGAIRTGAAAAGGAVAGPLGSGVGAFIGDRAATALGDKASLNAAKRRTVPISDFLKLNEGK
jgi:hypothetical protein